MSYVKLEDVKAAFPFLEKHKMYVLEKWWIDKMLDLEVPKTDAVKVVRCKDCKWHEHEEPNMVWCPYVVGSWIDDNGFCSCGAKTDKVEE